MKKISKLEVNKKLSRKKVQRILRRRRQTARTNRTLIEPQTAQKTNMKADSKPLFTSHLRSMATLAAPTA